MRPPATPPRCASGNENMVGLVAADRDDDHQVTLTLTGDAAQQLASVLIGHQAAHDRGVVPALEGYDSGLWLHLAIDLITTTVHQSIDDALVAANTVTARPLHAGSEPTA